MTAKKELERLARKFLAGKATDQEITFLDAYYQQFDNEPAVLDGFTDEELQALQAKMELNIQQRIQAPKRARIIPFTRWRNVAAAVLIVMAGLTYYIWSGTKSQQAWDLVAADIAPGKEGARLKLSDGRTLLIDSLADGLIAEDGQVKVYKKNGQIIYEGKTTELVYNEIVTDNGRQWSAQLTDGSTVWLNAASSLRYPLEFKGKERLVTMSGEASFNVIHNDKQPFRVQVREQVIEDIGTEFNINAYYNEAAIVTTVIEGIASVQKGEQKVVVSAGKQARDQNGRLSIQEADTDKAIAWRKGLFNFDGADIRTVGRQLERWYNITVAYAPGLPDYSFGGGTYRSNNLDEVLKVLELSGVKFRLEKAEGTSLAKLIVQP